MTTQARTLIALHAAASPRRAIHVGLLTIALAFGGVGTWAAWAPLSGAVIGDGTIKVENFRKSVQHLEGGIVKEILVRDGDTVKAGQPLIVLSDERNRATLAITQSQYDAELARNARLAAERDGLTRIDFPSASTSQPQDARWVEIVRMETHLFETRQRALRDQLALLSEQMSAARAESHALVLRRQSEASAQRTVAQELEANERLVSQGFISKMQVLRVKRAIDEYGSRLATTDSETLKVKQKVADLQLRANTLQSEMRKAAADEFAASQTRLAQLEEQLKPSADSVNRQQIVAPIAGTVIDMKFHTVGGVVGPREMVLDIIPENTPMMVETKIRLDDVRHVRQGMEADIRLTTYSSRETRPLKGRVTYVSADKMSDRATGMEYFVAHVSIEANLRSESSEPRLVSGMRAEVFLKTGARTALDYALAPVTGSLRKAGREP